MLPDAWVTLLQRPAARPKGGRFARHWFCDRTFVRAARVIGTVVFSTGNHFQAGAKFRRIDDHSGRLRVGKTPRLG
jgi:hypothetical protein